MERLSGTRYSYNKTRVAWLVPFVFLVPGGALMIVIFLLSSRALISGQLFSDVPPGVKLVTAGLILLGCFVAADLWRTFRRVLNEEICITERDIIWLGANRKVLVQAPHYEIKSLVRKGGSKPEDAWFFTVVTARGKIRFTRSIQHADELVGRIEGFLGHIK